jgi:hypothetical protein
MDNIALAYNHNARDTNTRYRVNHLNHLMEDTLIIQSTARCRIRIESHGHGLGSVGRNF